LLALTGDVLYRMADFDRAYSFYLVGIGADAKCARCYLGTGRIHDSAFRRESASKAFEKAYQLDALDPDIILPWGHAQAAGDKPILTVAAQAV
jgi:tetratricopeptide (TPR) repeat protein